MKEHVTIQWLPEKLAVGKAYLSTLTIAWWNHWASAGVKVGPFFVLTWKRTPRAWRRYQAGRWRNL